MTFSPASSGQRYLADPKPVAAHPAQPTGFVFLASPAWPLAVWGSIADTRLDERPVQFPLAVNFDLKLKF